MKQAREAILSFDDCRQFSITMYLEISRRLHGHRNYKGYLKARSITGELTRFLDDYCPIFHEVPAASRFFGIMQTDG